MSTIKNIRLKVSAEFHRVIISKGVKFQTRIQWKRHTNKAESELVSHEHGVSTINQTLILDFNMQYDQTKKEYLDKNTEIVAVVVYDGRVKSGGYAKYNIANFLNAKQEGKVQKIPLTQCPDPNACVQVTFTAQMLSQLGKQDDMSLLNASSRDLNMSRVDFHDDKLSNQMERIRSTIDKFNELAKTIKNREKLCADKLPQIMLKLEIAEGQNNSLRARVTTLEKQLERKEKQYREHTLEEEKQILQLEKQLQLKNKQIRSKQLIEQKQHKKNHAPLKDKANDSFDETTLGIVSDLNYKNKYEQALIEIESLRDLRSSINFNKMDEVHAFATFSMVEGDKDSLMKTVSELQAEKDTLQVQVAALSEKLAKLFNASAEYGGAKLLDHLQTAIGLIQT